VCGALGLPWVAQAAALNLTPDPAILIADIVVFLLLVYPTSRLVLRPIVRIIEDREKRSEGALAGAESFSREAVELRRELEARLREAHASAQSRRGEILAEAEESQRQSLERARGDAGRIVESVRSSVAEDLSAARTSLAHEARTLAREAASRILGRAL
jgi:F-type H+-transporting ATPase subunit b